MNRVIVGGEGSLSAEIAEEWKDIESYKGLYQISTHGRVKSLAKRGWNERMLRIQHDRLGYLHIILCKNYNKRTVRIHRLVAQAFIPNPKNKPAVNHKDCNRANNFVDNLEWVTWVEDKQHAKSEGRLLAGEMHSSSVLTKEEVLKIREMYSSTTKWTQQKLANIFGVSEGCIYHIVNRKTWKHIK